MVSVIKPGKNRKEHHPETESSKNSATTYDIGPVCGRMGKLTERVVEHLSMLYTCANLNGT